MKLEDGIGLICLNCNLRFKYKTDSIDEAYKKLVEEFYNQKIGILKKEVEKHKKSVPDILKRIVVKKSVDVVKYKIIEEKEIEVGKKTEELNIDEKIKRFLIYKGIRRLYKFQEEAIDKILKGKNVVIVAPTASGKTEAFIIPIVEKILRTKKTGVKALIMYPTKALARDQLKKFKLIERFTGVRFEVFDGDTTPEERRKIAENPPDVLISNPDMLNLHLSLPRSIFKDLVKNIDFLVLDEVHEYKGAFGSNIHFIIKRLSRFKDFTIIGASATIANAKEFCTMLFGREVEVIEGKGSKRTTHLLIIYPQLSEYSVIVEILKEVLREKLKTIVFANTHKNAEIITRIALKNNLNVAVHRAGLTAEYRHRVEEDFRHGKIDALIATPTLELGIDIGDVDAVLSLLVNYTRLIQRIGRAGRKGQESFAFLILRQNDPISNYYKEKPDDYFSDIEPAFIEPKNEVVAYYQIIGACLDKPLLYYEFREFEDVKRKLVEDGMLKKVDKVYIPTRKAREVFLKYNIRGGGESVKIILDNKYIGERNLPIAIRELFPNAIYLHAAKIYRVVGLDLEEKKAYLKSISEENIKTEPLRFTIPEIVKVISQREVYGLDVMFAKLRITEIVHGYIEKEIFTNKKIKEESIDPISYTYETKGFVFTAPKPSENTENLAGSFHALEHVLIESSNMLIGGGSEEIGGVSMGESGTIFIYDGAIGGNGVSKLLYDRLERAFERALNILKSCKCNREDGCPRCTYSYSCGNNNKPLYKPGAIESLEKIIKGKKQKINKAYIDERAYV